MRRVIIMIFGLSLAIGPARSQTTAADAATEGTCIIKPHVTVQLGSSRDDRFLGEIHADAQPGFLASGRGTVF